MSTSTDTTPDGTSTDTTPDGTSTDTTPDGTLTDGTATDRAARDRPTAPRRVGAHLRITVETPARLAVQVAVADPASVQAVESISIRLDGGPANWRDLTAPHGGRMWLLDVPAGQVAIDYSATLSGTGPEPAVLDADTLLYLRPSRYCESDRLLGFAVRHFAGVRGPGQILAAVSSWVGSQLAYVSGSSGPTDGAVDTLLAGRGVCRDYAHLAVALLRALEVPARVVAVYAPGLKPMDFHAVAEAFVDGAWYVVDGTLLAPRSSLVRIATGRDASDISFLSSYGGAIVLDRMEVRATVDGPLPGDDVFALVPLR